ncbi:MAG: hypothetical protein HC903_19755 [Methylacidiphilales bacterium]|nr:hypothetical protein [Candidatus Methylacidiphilales bacterium]
MTFYRGVACFWASEYGCSPNIILYGQTVVYPILSRRGKRLFTQYYRGKPLFTQYYPVGVNGYLPNIIGVNGCLPNIIEVNDCLFSGDYTKK